MLEKLEAELRAFERDANGRDWKDPAVLEELCAQVRNIGSKFCHSGDLQGFVLSANGVDVSRRLLEWPAHVFEGSQLKFAMSYLEAGDLKDKNGIVAEVVLHEPVVIFPSALKAPAEKPVAEPAKSADKPAVDKSAEGK